jgi:hypothetical protein
MRIAGSESFSANEQSAGIEPLGTRHSDGPQTAQAFG